MTCWPVFAREGIIDALVSVGGTVRPLPMNCTAKGCAWWVCPRPSTTTWTRPSPSVDTAVTFATECLDRLHSTAESHQRIMVVEMMGRYAGWISLHAGIAGGAHAILIPEIPFDLEPVVAQVQERDALGRSYSLVVVAEAPIRAKASAPCWRRPGPGMWSAWGHGRAGGAGVGPPHRQGCPGRGAGASAARRQPNGLDRLAALRLARPPCALDEGCPA